jgi:CMP-N-acetylneuraminic acid synthetase
MTSVAALVPMRHQSERVPGKNYRLMAGKPLFHYILETLLACPEIDQVVVDTDSAPISDDIQVHFPGVRVIQRPDHLRSGMIPMNEILLYDTRQVQADLYLQTHSTNPLLKPQSVSRAVQTLLEQYPSYDSLFSVTRLQTRLWDGLGRAVNHNPAILLRTQDLPPIYEENSCLYLFDQATLETRHNRIGERPYLFEIDAAEAWDIDDELDFAITDFLVNRARKGQKET